MLQLIVRCAVLVILIPALMGQSVAVTDCTLIDPGMGRQRPTAVSSSPVAGSQRAAQRLLC